MMVVVMMPQNDWGFGIEEDKPDIRCFLLLFCSLPFKPLPALPIKHCYDDGMSVNLPSSDQ